VANFDTFCAAAACTNVCAGSALRICGAVDIAHVRCAERPFNKSSSISTDDQHKLKIKP